MPITLTAIPAGTASSRPSLDDISADVKAAVEDAYTYNLDAPAERLEAEFDTQKDADDFLKDARAYAYQREAGRLIVTGNSTKARQIVDDKGPRTVSYARFRVNAYVEAEEGAEAE